MDFANRGGRPTPQPQPQQQPTPQMGGMNGMENTQSPLSPVNAKKAKRGFTFGKISSELMLFGVALLAVVMIVALVFGGKSTSVRRESGLIDTSKYQAIFLDSQDGQVYFGKLAIYNTDLYVLEDIYYVRVENPIQPEGANQQAQPNISLAKLGNELHGPQDRMLISRTKVLYWENLKDDGQVVKAIVDFKANGENANATTPAAETPAETPTTTQQQSTQPASTNQQNDTPAETPTTPTTPTVP